MSRSEENRGFTCAVCEARVRPLTNGSYRNHCPLCLSSLHVDNDPGDRVSACVGVMDAIALRRVRKGMQVVHKCRKCGVRRRNRVADRGDQPDAVDALIHLTHLPG